MNNNNIRTESLRFYALAHLKNGFDRITANFGGQRPLVRSKTATVRCQRPPVEND